MTMGSTKHQASNIQRNSKLQSPKWRARALDWPSYYAGLDFLSVFGF
jgi:hypothetical protein